MFSKLIPNSVAAGNGPRGGQGGVDPKKAAIAALPPTFRGPDAELDFRPGGTIVASDRSYRVAQDGSLRRPKATIQEEQISASQERMRRRLEERLDRKDAAHARKKAARALAKAKRSQEKVSEIQRYVQAHRNLLAATDPDRTP